MMELGKAGKLGATFSRTWAPECEVNVTNDTKASNVVDVFCCSF